MGKSLANLLIQNSQWPGFWRHCSLVHAKTTQIQSVFSACRPIMLLSCWLSPCRHQMWLTINTCYYYTRLTASFPGQRGWAGTRKAKTSLDLNESRASRIVSYRNRKRWWSFGCNGISWTICKQSADNHINTSSLVFAGWMLLLTPNQQCQSTKGKWLTIV